MARAVSASAATASTSATAASAAGNERTEQHAEDGNLQRRLSLPARLLPAAKNQDHPDQWPAEIVPGQMRRSRQARACRTGRSGHDFQHDVGVPLS